MKPSGIVLLLALCLAGCNLSASGGGEETRVQGDLAATRQSLAPLAESLLVRINHDRDVLGLPGYTPAQALGEVAGLRAEDMLLRGYLGPIGPEDASVAAQELMGAAGFRGRLGELIYEHLGPADSLVDTTVAAWLTSQAHRALLLDRAYAFVGIALIGDGQRWIIVLELAERGP